MSDPRIGTVVGDRFELLSKVGEGGMGVVYLANDSMGDEQAAVKFLHAQFMAKEEFVQRFRQEGKSASRFRHPNAVQILQAGEDDEGIPWLAMEYCPGRSLKGVLRDESPLSVERVCSIGRQILDAVGEGHKNGIIHRDLKPENIKVELGPQGREKVKVLDFGVAKFVGTEDEEEMEGAVKTKTGVVFGTPKYMAPEQILGEPVDGRSDLYSIGAILYEMVTGGPPFPSDDIMGFVTKHLKEPVEPMSTRAPNLKVPAELEEIVHGLLAKNRKDRPSRATDVVRMLDELLSESPSTEEEPAAGPKGAIFLAGGVLAAAASFAFGPAGAAVAAGLGIGATIAYFMFPRIGETAFCLRTLIVAVLVAISGAAAAFGMGARGYLALGLGTGAVFVYVLFSAGWGRRARGQAFLLGGVVAPLVAIPLLPFPVGDDGYGRVWELSGLDAAALGPALALFVIALVFSATAFLVPLPAERGE